MRKTIYILCMLLVSAFASAQSRLHYVVDALQRDIKAWETEYQPYMHDYERNNDSILAATARECHNIRLTLYSCDNMGFFDLTHELHAAVSLYKRIDELAQPDNASITEAQRDMKRMQYLLETLRRMPPELDEIEEVSDSISALESDTLLMALAMGGRLNRFEDEDEDDAFYILSEEEQVIRDSCVIMARHCIKHLQRSVNTLSQEAINFSLLRDEFKSTYDYADQRYQELTQDVYFGRPQLALSNLLTHPIAIVQHAIEECRVKFTATDSIYTAKEFYVVLAEMFGALALAILITILLKYATMRWKQKLIRLHRNTKVVGNTIYMLLLLICLIVDVHVFHLPLVTTNTTTFMVYFIYVMTLQLSLLLRCAGTKAAAGVRLYVPSILCGFFLIFMRMYFVPDLLLSIVMIPLTTACCIWQMLVLVRVWTKCTTLDNTIAAATTLIFLLTAILSMLGHALLSLQIVFWWESQQAFVVIIAAIYHIMKEYGDQQMGIRTTAYLQQRNGHVEEGQTAIQLTWLYDMIKMVVLPALSIASVPLCIYMSLRFFNAQENFIETYKSTFFSLGVDQDIFDLSIEKIAVVLTLFFCFNFVRYVSVCIYRQASMNLERKRSTTGEILTNQVNLTLGTNLINLLVWGLYVTSASVILKIPMTALTIIIGAFTGGIGFAMKDVMNNIIYGTQLMAGRLRVGDYIICDNYRGSVSSISYQTTQIVTEEGALVAFTNADLFNKNFQNLTRHNPYEVNRVTINVAYGSDIEKVERLIREAIEPLNQKDKFGRMLLSPQEGLRIEMRDLAENGITMAVRFGVIAEKRTWFLPVARKAIYKKITSNGIEIPFPQMDLHQK